MVFRIAGSFLREAKRHIQERDRYRYYPLYSAGLAGLVYLWWIWPADFSFFKVLYFNPWLNRFYYVAVDAACLMAACCGVVGLFRRGLAPKVLSVAGVYAAIWWWDPVLFVGGLMSDFLWYVFDQPDKYIVRIAGVENGASTLLWCGYLLVVYLLLRPVLKLVFKGVRSIARRAIDRYPPLVRLDRPIL